MITYLITGSCGTIGSALVKKFASDGSDCLIRCFDNSESLLHFQQRTYKDNPKVETYIGDIRDFDRLTNVMHGVDIVLHTAALKHVGICEYSPMEAVQTNILGLNNVIKSASEAEADKFVFMSSDKAVNPTNVLGTTKLMGERLVTAANLNKGMNHTKFFSLRFGNVLGSNGSVVPVFEEQIMQGGPLTLTDRNMTRFIMSVNDTVQLVERSLGFAKGGEVFVTKMPAIRIESLAEAMVNHLNQELPQYTGAIEIKEIGKQSGEKLFEELMTEEESKRAIETEEFFMILPAFHEYYSETISEYEHVDMKLNIGSYVSENGPYLTEEELIAFLSENDVFRAQK